jgi:uncharacterized membrane protein
VTLLVGLAVAVPTALVAPVEMAALIGWDVAVLVYVVWVWSLIYPLDGPATGQHAQREDPTRPLADLLLLAAAVGSLVAVGLVLIHAGDGGDTSHLPIVLGVVSVVLSWAMIHTLFTLRYADLYYQGDGGIDFNQDDPPRYLDFAYLAFTIGMTFQVSDTNIGDGAIRRAALGHALLSFLFGTVIVATTINLVVGLST